MEKQLTQNHSEHGTKSSKSTGNTTGRKKQPISQNQRESQKATRRTQHNRDSGLFCSGGSHEEFRAKFICKIIWLLMSTDRMT